MGKRYLIDTNVIIEYLGGLLPKTAFLLISKIIDEEFNISVVNKIEVLGHVSAGEKIVNFIDLANIYYLSEDVVDQTIKLRKLYKIKLPDAIIAATAIVNNLIVVTRNIKDFEIISELKVVNPYNIS
jgi:predicted nucleic acid-binding protein